MEVAVRSIIKTSIVKSRPANGALKIPAIPAAAPHPTSSMRVRGSSRKSFPKFDPIAAPVYTIGASAPTDPPKPMVMELATTELYILWGFNRLLRCDIAYKTLLQKQVQFIRKNQDDILKKHANVVYVNRKKGRMDIGYIKNATPDFELLEAKCDEWIRWHENKE